MYLQNRTICASQSEQVRCFQLLVLSTPTLRTLGLCTHITAQGVSVELPQDVYPSTFQANLGNIVQQAYCSIGIRPTWLRVTNMHHDMHHDVHYRLEDISTRTPMTFLTDDSHQVSPSLIQTSQAVTTGVWYLCFTSTTWEHQNMCTYEYIRSTLVLSQLPSNRCLQGHGDKTS